MKTYKRQLRYFFVFISLLFLGVYFFIKLDNNFETKYEKNLLQQIYQSRVYTPELLDDPNPDNVKAPHNPYKIYDVFNDANGNDLYDVGEERIDSAIKVSTHRFYENDTIPTNELRIGVQMKQEIYDLFDVNKNYSSSINYTNNSEVDESAEIEAKNVQYWSFGSEGIDETYEQRLEYKTIQAFYDSVNINSILVRPKSPFNPNKYIAVPSDNDNVVLTAPIEPQIKITDINYLTDYETKKQTITVSYEYNNYQLPGYLNLFDGIYINFYLYEQGKINPVEERWVQVTDSASNKIDEISFTLNIKPNTSYYVGTDVSLGSLTIPSYIIGDWEVTYGEDSDVITTGSLGTSNLSLGSINIENGATLGKASYNFSLNVRESLDYDQIVFDSIAILDQADSNNILVDLTTDVNSISPDATGLISYSGILSELKINHEYSSLKLSGSYKKRTGTSDDLLPINESVNFSFDFPKFTTLARPAEIPEINSIVLTPQKVSESEIKAVVTYDFGFSYEFPQNEYALTDISSISWEATPYNYDDFTTPNGEVLNGTVENPGLSGSFDITNLLFNRDYKVDFLITYYLNPQSSSEVGETGELTYSGSFRTEPRGEKEILLSDIVISGINTVDPDATGLLDVSFNLSVDSSGDQYHEPIIKSGQIEYLESGGKKSIETLDSIQYGSNSYQFNLGINKYYSSSKLTVNFQNYDGTISSKDFVLSSEFNTNAKPALPPTLELYNVNPSFNSVSFDYKITDNYVENTDNLNLEILSRKIYLYDGSTEIGNKSISQNSGSSSFVNLLEPNQKNRYSLKLEVEYRDAPNSLWSNSSVLKIETTYNFDTTSTGEYPPTLSMSVKPNSSNPTTSLEIDYFITQSLLGDGVYGPTNIESFSIKNLITNETQNILNPFDTAEISGSYVWDDLNPKTNYSFEGTIVYGSDSKTITETVDGKTDSLGSASVSSEDLEISNLLTDKLSEASFRYSISDKNIEAGYDAYELDHLIIYDESNNNIFESSNSADNVTLYNLSPEQDISKLNYSFEITTKSGSSKVLSWEEYFTKAAESSTDETDDLFTSKLPVPDAEFSYVEDSLTYDSFQVLLRVTDTNQISVFDENSILKIVDYHLNIELKFSISKYNRVTNEYLITFSELDPQQTYGQEGFLVSFKIENIEWEPYLINLDPQHSTGITIPEEPEHKIKKILILVLLIVLILLILFVGIWLIRRLFKNKDKVVKVSSNDW